VSKACLVDTTKCIGCRACQVACKQWNELLAEKTRFRAAGGDYENPPALSSKTYTRITFHEILDSDEELDQFVFVKRQCMHCGEPACVSACPVAALEKVKVNGDSEGPVIYHAHKCLGCRYCMLACPFDVPTLEWEKALPEIKKCTFCADRFREEAANVRVNDKLLSGESLERFQEGQRTPACAKVCPTGAIEFGEREDMIAEARKRIAERKNRRGSWQYVDHIYGEKEVGGTDWLYLANVPFDKLGFRTDLGERAYPEYANLALDAVPPAVIGVGAVLGGVYWVSNRRSEAENAGLPGDTSPEE
jgi:formate dehydrogenase iron-sulfur subunit